MKRDQILYGDKHGNYAILDWPIEQNFMSPPVLDEFFYLGPVTDVITRLNYTHSQSQLAKDIGIGQQAISNHIRKRGRVELKEEGWRELTIMAFNELL